MSFLRLTLRQIKWTKFKKWKRNHSKKFNFELNLFIWFRINYSRNWECFDQSCGNRTESVHRTLRFLFSSHLLYRICVKVFIMNWCISKSYTTTKNGFGRQYTERGQLYSGMLKHGSPHNLHNLAFETDCFDQSLWNLANSLSSWP